MISGIKAFIIGFKLAIAESMAYRSSFFISMAIMFVFELLFPIVSVLIYRSGVSFPGWSIYEVLLIQGAFIMAKGIAFPLFIGMFFQTMWRIKSGSFDVILLRPRSVLFTNIITSFNTFDLCKFFSGLLLLIIALLNLPAPNVWQWICFILLIIVSVILVLSFIILMCVYTIRFVGSDRVLSLIEPVSQFGLYPRSILVEPIKTIATNIIPVTLIGFYPATVLLGKSTKGIIFAVITALCFITVSMILWFKSIGKYTSAGG